MKAITLVSCSIISLLAVSGCRSTAPAPVNVVRGAAAGQQSPAANAGKDDVKKQREKVAQLERSLAERQQMQMRLERELETIRKDLYSTALTIREIKNQTDALAGLHATNTLALAALDQELKAQREQLVALEKSATAAPREVANLQAALQAEQQQRAKQEALAREREKEAQDLRKALEARDAAMKQQPQRPTHVASVPPSAPPKPPPSVSPPPVAPAKPAVADVSAYKLVADANELLKKRDLIGAERMFQSALEADPGLVSARIGLAACYYSLNRLPDASRLVDEVLKADPNNAQALGLQGIILWQRGELRDASDALERALKREPNDSQLHNYMGIVLHARKRQDDAIREMRKAVELDANNVEARMNLAILLATSKAPMMEEARRNYELAISMGAERDATLDKVLYGELVP